MMGAGEMLVSLSRSEILRVKARALRRGVWYRVLTKVERACVDLVVRVVERVRSRLLSRVLFSVLAKLDAAMESRVWRLIREIGVGLASRICQVAQDWGNKSAAGWARDVGFVRYLTLMHLNAP